MSRKLVLAVVLSLVSALLAPLGALAAPGPTTPSGVPIDELAAHIDRQVAEHLGETSPGVAVVVVKDGSIVFSKGYGYADLANDVPVDSARTVFEYGSVSKLFTYAAIMRLVEEERLDLAADIRTYLPDGFLRKLRYDEAITLFQVMNHTTGFEDYLFDTILTTPDGLPGLEEALAASQPEQVYPPGTISAYSNYAVALAGYVVQRVTGVGFADYLNDAYFGPLGMRDASAHPTLADKPSLIQQKARGYLPLPASVDPPFREGPWSYIPLYPAGSINGTAEDLARLAIALTPPPGQSGPLFGNRETLDEMLSQSHSLGPGVLSWAHGFSERGGRYRSLGHGGNTASFSAQMNIVPEQRFGVVVLANAGGEMALTEGLTKTLLGKTQALEAPYPGSMPEPSNVAGVYITARRPHSGFLQLFSYLTMVHIAASTPEMIEVRFAGQTAEYVQTRPYMFSQVAASGPIFEHHFKRIYFEVEDGGVQRVSGDFLPLPPGRTRPWLWADGSAGAICAVFFALAPAVLIIGALIRWWRRRRDPGAAPGVQRAPRLYTALVLSGTALLANNLLLLLRIAINNYRSFAEVRPQVLLNYPLALVAVVVGGLAVYHSKREDLVGRRWLALTTAVLLAASVWLLVKWGFFDLIA